MYEPKVGELVAVVYEHSALLNAQIVEGEVVGFDAKVLLISDQKGNHPLMRNRIISVFTLPPPPPPKPSAFTKIAPVLKTLISRAVTTAVVTATAGGVYALGKYHTEIAAVVGWLFDMVTQ